MSHRFLVVHYNSFPFLRLHLALININMEQLTRDTVTYRFTEHKNLVKTEADKGLFQLFAYGRYQPTLNLDKNQALKLRMLTLISLCETSKRLTFAEI